jgi:ribosome-associated toxin RatA of RatAB toxin-antitoxin module
VKEVAVAVQRTSITSRVLVAAVDIAAPPSAVWGALTDYERLSDFIPSLEKNECLARDPSSGTARLRQVGAQDVAMGVKFRAAVTLDIREHKGPGGIPPDLVTTSLDSRDYLGKGARFPAPVAVADEDEDAALAEAAQAMEGQVPTVTESLMSVDEGDEANGAVGAVGAAAINADKRARRSWPRDISFELVEGDFSAFRGIWRISEGPAGPLTARLASSVFVQPQAFLPVGLIQGRISRDVATNLKSVRAHAEEVVFERLLAKQREEAEAAAAVGAAAAVV